MLEYNLNEVIPSYNIAMRMVRFGFLKTFLN